MVIYINERREGIGLRRLRRQGPVIKACALRLPAPTRFLDEPQADDVFQEANRAVNAAFIRKAIARLSSLMRGSSISAPINDHVPLER